jgi:hypothetical protein
MGKLDIHMCPETGICSVFKEDGTKIDMMPGEVADLKDAAGDPEKIKEVISQVDKTFTEDLGDEEINQLTDELK